MKFEHEPWVKLYRRITPEWLSLPLSARGLGRELLVYADDRGLLVTCRQRAMIEQLSRRLAVNDSEIPCLRRDVKLLLDVGYLVYDQGSLIIRNYSKAQARSTSAERTRRWRERRHGDASQTASPGDSGDKSRVTDTNRRDPPIVPQGGRGANAPVGESTDGASRWVTRL